MADSRTFVIVGAGLAGGKAAETLRQEGFEGRVVLVGAEPHRPYERPPLSKDLLLGKSERDAAFVHPAGWYDEHRVELLLDTEVTGLDTARHEVTLSGGGTLAYDKLLLTTGGRPRSLDVPGGAAALTLRTLAESEAIGAMFGDGARLVIIGAGWIGLEVAAAARQRGAEVTVVELAALPLQRTLGDELAAVFRDLHVQHGVDFRFGTGIAEIRDGSTAVLSDGSEITGTAVIAAVGIAPNTALAEGAGLAVDDGILVDASLRTSDPDVYAAGDVANREHPVLGRSVRVEHWANALDGGPVAARAMLGQDATFDALPYFFTDQYDLGMEYAGYAEPGAYDRVVYRGEPGPASEFIAFWLRDNRVLAGMNVNVWDVTDQIQAIIRAGKQVDPDRLADPDVPLSDLA
jgi:3-phenylpropionate/trans-cinnamate dioxygenase ferredoxin reductase component